MAEPHTIVRIVPHEESFEVRVSTFFYFDETPGRRSITGRPDQETAKKLAQEFARSISDSASRS